MSQVEVKAPSARYNSKRFEGKHFKSGQPVFDGRGEVVTTPSQREHALFGAFMRALVLRSGVPGIRPLDPHERDLLHELQHDHLWCGDHGGEYYTGVKLQDALQLKGTDLIADNTSGGTSLVPFLFDTDIVTFPLLNGELAPYVTMKDIPRSNSVHTASLGNVTAAWGTTEGYGNAISLQTTDSLVASITSAVCNIAMAITVGRDFLSDSPVDVGKELQRLMGERLTAELDRVIAVGNGSTEPQGLTQASSVVTYSAVNGSAGPILVSDVEGMISALPKQYRANEPSVCWVGPDKAWFHLRAIAVNGSTDQRRIFGYDYERYMLSNRPWRVQNDLTQVQVAFVKLALYRLWRRMGLEIQVTREGLALATQNEILIVARGRYAGKLTDGGGCVYCANFPKT